MRPYDGRDQVCLVALYQIETVSQQGVLLRCYRGFVRQGVRKKRRLRSGASRNIVFD
jgi:hypothetical protein